MPPKKVKAGTARSQSEVFHADPQRVATAIAAAVAALQEVGLSRNLNLHWHGYRTRTRLFLSAM
jgi:hypothetical protein